MADTGKIEGMVNQTQKFFKELHQFWKDVRPEAEETKDSLDKLTDSLVRMNREVDKIDKKQSKSLRNRGEQFNKDLRDHLDEQVKLLKQFQKIEREYRQKESEKESEANNALLEKMKTTMSQIQESMVENQKVAENNLNILKRDYVNSYRFIDRTSQSWFDTLIETSEMGLEKVQKVMDDHFSEIARDERDELDIRRRFTSSFSKELKGMLSELRQTAVDLNITSMASSLTDGLQDAVDSYMDNMRELRTYANGNIDESAISDAVTKGIEDSGYAISRSEASSMLSDFIKESGIKKANEYMPFMGELAASSKAFGTSFSNVDKILYADLNSNQGGSLYTSVNNLVGSLQSNADLYVDGQGILESINENINDIYGISKGDPKRQMKMIKSLSSIESIQQSEYNKGVDTVAEQMKEWTTMSRYELMEDEKAQYWAGLTGMTTDDIYKMLQNGDSAKLMGIIGNTVKDYSDEQIHALRDNLGFGKDAEFMQLREASKDREGGSYLSQDIKATGESIENSDNNTGSVAQEMAKRSSGIVEKFKNWFSNNPALRVITDIFGEFDVKMANLANATIVADSAINIGKGIGKFGKSAREFDKKTGGRGNIFFGAGKMAKDTAKGFLNGSVNILHDFGDALSSGGKGMTTIGGKASGKLAERGIEGLGKGVGAVGKNVGGLMSSTGLKLLGVGVKTLVRGFTGVIGFLSAITDFTSGIDEKATQWFGQNATTKQRVVSGVANTLTGGGEGFFNGIAHGANWAAIGASIGSVIAPGIGTGIGAGLGGALGLITGWIGNRRMASGLDMLTGGNDVQNTNSYASGLSYVPYDNMSAILHKGEAVLTEKQAEVVRADGGIDTNKLFNDMTKVSFATNPLLGGAYTMTNSLGMFGNNNNKDKKLLSSSLKDALGTGKVGGGSSPLEKSFISVFGISNADKNDSDGGLFGSILKKLGIGGKGGILNKFFGSGSASSGGSSGDSSGGAIVNFNSGRYDADVASKPHGDVANAVATQYDLPAKLIYAQMQHESGNFTNWGSRKANNYTGMTTSMGGRFKTEDGYTIFPSDADFVEWYGKTLANEPGIRDATDAQSWAEALKKGGYYEASVEEYANGVNRFLNQNGWLGDSKAEGTPWVPNDHIALIHEGEMIVPATVNPYINENLDTANTVDVNSVTNTPNNAVDFTQYDNTDVIETLKWMVYRMETKLDTLISVESQKGRPIVKKGIDSDILDMYGM